MLRDQKDIMDHIRKWCHAVTFRTDPADREKAEAGVMKLYRELNIDEPQIVWFESLPAAEFAFCLLTRKEPWWVQRKRINMELSKYDDNIPESFWESLDNSLKNITCSRTASDIHDWSSYVTERITDRLEKDAPVDILMLAAKIQDEIGYINDMQIPQQYAQLCPELRGVGTVHNSIAGYWIECLRFIDFDDPVASSCPAIARFVHEIDLSCFLWFPLENLVFMVESPLSVKQKNWKLHCDGGPAVIWRDGVQSWFLNGMIMKREYVETSSENISATVLMKEGNAEIRRELVKKIGIQRLCEDLGAKVIDRYENYELLLLNLEVLDVDSDSYRPFLKMINPSTQEIHIEGVPRGIMTVKEALAFRNGTDEIPITIT